MHFRVSLAGVHALRNAFEREHGVVYDLVFGARFDLQFGEPIVLPVPKPGVIYGGTNMNQIEKGIDGEVFTYGRPDVMDAMFQPAIPEAEISRIPGYEFVGEAMFTSIRDAHGFAYEAHRIPHAILRDSGPMQIRIWPRPAPVRRRRSQAGSAKIRAFTDADWEAVRTIYDLSKPDEMRGSVDMNTILPLFDDPKRLAAIRDSSLIVVEDVGRVIAFAGHTGNHIGWLYVHPEHRRRGLGSALVSELLERLDEPVTLNVGKYNLVARTLYQRFGFVIENEFTGDFNGHAVDVMTLRYDSPGQDTQRHQ